MVLAPRAGYRISGVFGVPDGLMTDAGEGAVMITVPTAFLSTNGGGIFLSLAKAAERDYLPAAAIAPGTPLLEVSLSYVGAQDGREGTDRLTVAAPDGGPSAPLRTAHLLVDQYFAMHGATTAFHRDGDTRGAYRLLSGISDRLAGSNLAGLDNERELVGNMLQQAAFYAGYAGEMPRAQRHLAVVGNWQIGRAEGIEDLRRGDTLFFTSEQELRINRRNPRRNEAGEETEPYQINEGQIYLPQSNLVFNYRTRGDRLTLIDESGYARLVLARAGAPEAP
jgi:Ca-activated chloride channel family protein